jgi:transposase-like protein
MALRINWTEDEIEFVKENYKKITFFKIASRLNRSYGAVWGLVKSLGLNKNKREYRCWTEDEILFIKNTDNSIMGVAKKLNRSYLDVYTKARNLGLSESLKSNKKKAKKKKREEVIFLYKKGHTYKEIESIMRISNNALYRILREEGVELRNSEMKKKRDLALSLYEKGENTKDIIRKTNLSQTTIYDEARKKNVNRTKPGVVSRYNKETRDEACRLYLEGVGIVDILTILKIKYSAELYKFLRDEKIGLRTKINK